MSNNFCEIMINKKKFESLPEEFRMALRMASLAASADAEWKSMSRMSTDFIELQTVNKINAYRTPKVILDAQLKAWDAVIRKRSAENALFAKVVESQKAWAKRVIYWHLSVQVDQQAGYAHYFGKGPIQT